MELTNRKISYMVALSWYYTFIVIYSLTIGFTDVLISTFIITVISYIWVVRTAAKGGAFENLNYKELFVNILIYMFSSLYIAMMTLFLSGDLYNGVKIAMLISPIVIWVIIWFDYFSQKIHGKEV